MFGLGCILACGLVEESPGGDKSSFSPRVVTPQSPSDSELAKPITAEPFPGVEQLILVVSDDWQSVDAELWRFSRTETGWLPSAEPFPVNLGINGLGWGRGLREPVAEPGEPVKKEGDGKAPAGVFSISIAFGYAGRPPLPMSLPYMQSSPSMVCVDDSKSASYNRIVDSSVVAKDWKSRERMLRQDEIYRWGAFVDHNADQPRPGSGSCIFLHIWRGKSRGTLGCTSMAEENLLSLLGWIAGREKTVLVQLPRTSYTKVKELWGLPDPNPGE